MLKALAYPFNLLRKRFLMARLRELERNATVLQAHMLTDPLKLAEYRIGITETRRALAAIEGARS